MNSLVGKTTLQQVSPEVQNAMKSALQSRLSASSTTVLKLLGQREQRLTIMSALKQKCKEAIRRFSLTPVEVMTVLTLAPTVSEVLFQNISDSNKYVSLFQLKSQRSENKISPSIPPQPQIFPRGSSRGKLLKLSVKDSIPLICQDHSLEQTATEFLEQSVTGSIQALPSIDNSLSKIIPPSLEIKSSHAQFLPSLGHQVVVVIFLQNISR